MTGDTVIRPPQAAAGKWTRMLRKSFGAQTSAPVEDGQR
jgi:hypothetical protein